MRLRTTAVLAVVALAAGCCHSLSIGRHVRPAQTRLSAKPNHNHVSPTNNVDSYVLHWNALLSEEHRAAVADLHDQQRRWSPSRLQASGISLRGVSAEPDEEVLGEKIVRIYYSSGTTTSTLSLRDVYTRGDILILTPEEDIIKSNQNFGGFYRRRRRSRNNKSRRRSSQSTATIQPREVCVVDVGTDWMTASVGLSWPTGLWEARKTIGQYPVRLDRTVPQTTLLAQQTALNVVRRGKAGMAAELMVETFLEKDDINDATTMIMMDHTNNATTTIPITAESRAAQSPTWLQKTGATPATIRAAIVDSIHESQKQQQAKQQPTTGTNNATTKARLIFQPNQSQHDAIAWALSRRASLIIGPPGCGKTICAALLISSAVRLQARVLAVAHSNNAADVLLQALLDQGVPAVRVGRPASIAPSVRHRTVVAMAQQHPAVTALRRKVMDPSLETHARNTATREVVRCLQDVQRMITTTASVVVASCIGAHQLLQLTEDHHDTSCRFDMVVLDEAAQTTEPALLCALAAAKAEQVVLVGDTRQLPPTIAGNSVELRDSLGVSPMARLELCGVGQHTLREQYRMSPGLLQFPSRYFYKGLVTCAHDFVQTGPPPGFPWPPQQQPGYHVQLQLQLQLQLQPIAFVEVGPNLEVTHDRGGKSNPTEAALVVQIVSDLQSAAAAGGEDIEIAVISPYAKQVQLIRSSLLLLGRQGRDSVRVGTVDSFQGKETDVVIVSATRSNGEQELGFLRDPRRLCVALTRAKRGLVVVGDPHVLQTSRPWEALIQSCRDRGCMLQPKDLECGVAATTHDDKQSMLDDAGGPTETEEAPSDAALLASLEDSLGENDDTLLELLSTVLDATGDEQG